MPNTREATGAGFHQLVVTPGLMLGVSVTGCMSVPLAFTPHHFGAFVAAAIAGAALWAAILRLSESKASCLIDWQVVPTFLGLITFIVRLIAGDQLYALWVVSSVAVLFTVGVVYLNRRAGRSNRTSQIPRATEGKAVSFDLDQIHPATPEAVAA